MTEAKRILIVDDEALARQRIARYLRQSGQPLSIAEADSGLRAVELLSTFRPDVVFLDVEMPGLNGFEVLQQFDERDFHVIFQTAHDQFALRAFEECACDYLLKPFTAARLQQALARALTRVADEARLRALETQLLSRDGYLRKLSVKQGTRWRIVTELEIECFLSRDHYTCVYFNAGQEGITELSLSKLAERLDPAVFRQMHRNNIVRVAAVTALLRTRQGELWLALQNGMKLPVSRTHRRAAVEIFQQRTI